MSSAKFVLPDYSGADNAPGDTAKARAERAQTAAIQAANNPSASGQPAIANSNARQGRPMDASQGSRPKSKGNVKSVVPLT